MSKLYTLDGKLLTETPEIRIGEKIYPVDNRQKTVKQMQAVIEQQQGKENPMDGVAGVLELAFGPTPAQEIEDMNMPYPAYQCLFELVVAAMTGEDPDTAPARFRNT